MSISDSNKTLVQICMLLALIGVLYTPVFRDLMTAWDNKPQSSHGYLILPISLYLIYRKKAQILKIDPKANFAGFLLVCIGVVMYFVGVIGKVSTFSNISLIFNILGIILSLGGTKLIRALIWPALFLIFMFPIPDAIYVALTAPLKIFASYVSVEILQLIGLPILREGNLIQLPNMSLEVVEACSGLRSLTSYIILGVLMAYLLTDASKTVKIIFIALALPISVVVNIMRIVGTGLLATYFGADLAQGFFHKFSGVVVFMIGMVVYFFLFSIISRISVLSHK